MMKPIQILTTLLFLSAGGGSLLLAQAAPVAGPAPPPTEEPAAASESWVTEELQDVFDLMTIGSPDAPYELVILASFDCNICQRFEERQLPTLMERAVDPGLLRIRFIVPPSVGKGPSGDWQFIAAHALAAAGQPVDKILGALRNKDVQSVPNGIHAISDEAARERAKEYIRTTGAEVDWKALIQAHRLWSRKLRTEYFESGGGTPYFMLRETDGPITPHAIETYLFKGYQLADPMLEFMGLEVEKKEKSDG